MTKDEAYDEAYYDEFGEYPADSPKNPNYKGGGGGNGGLNANNIFNRGVDLLGAYLKPSQKVPPRKPAVKAATGKTNWMPWIIGGVAVLVIGGLGLVLVMGMGRRGTA